MGGLVYEGCMAFMDANRLEIYTRGHTEQLCCTMNSSSDDSLVSTICQCMSKFRNNSNQKSECITGDVMYLSTWEFKICANTVACILPILGQILFEHGLHTIGKKTIKEWYKIVLQRLECNKNGGNGVNKERDESRNEKNLNSVKKEFDSIENSKLYLAVLDTNENILLRHSVKDNVIAFNWKVNDKWKQEMLYPLAFEYVSISRCKFLDHKRFFIYHLSSLQEILQLYCPNCPNDDNKRIKVDYSDIAAEILSFASSNFNGCRKIALAVKRIANNSQLTQKS